jgi:hypothetical protein
MDRQTPPTAEVERYDRALQARYVTLQAELLRRLESEPGVSAAIMLEGVPGVEPTVRMEVEGTPADAESPDAAPVVGTRRISPDHFDVFDVPLLAGRRFHSADMGLAASVRLRDGDGDGIAEVSTGDLSGASTTVILGGGPALGRRVRAVRERTGEPGPWYEIVGIVSDFPPNRMEPDWIQAKVFYPMAQGEIFERLAVRVRGPAPGAFAGRLREIAAALDPSLRLTSISTLDRVLREEQLAMRLGALAIGLVMLSVLLLSAAGIYALMSFTVARRRREIGVRSALGADPRRILGSILSRALGQLAIGVVAGTGVATLLDLATKGAFTGGQAAVLLPAVAAFMVIVGLVATLGPARRGLRIQPTEALRDDA